MSIDKKLGFIVGHYKSGSTWLSHLLSLHPGIRGVREAHIFRYAKEHKTLQDASNELFNESAWAAGGDGQFPRYWLSNATRRLRVMLGMATGTASLNSQNVPTSMHDLGYISQLRLRSKLDKAVNRDEYLRIYFSFLVNKLKPKNYLIEKTPTNIFYIDEIKRVFPESKLISIYRDGRDVVLSDLHHLRRTKKAEQSFEQRVLKWKSAMQADLDFAKKFGTYLLSYEDLKQNPIDNTRSLLSFLELDFDEELITNMIQNSSFEAMSGGRSEGKEDTSNFFRKGVVGDWQNAFTEDEIKLFSDLAGEQLVELGYESSPDYKNWS